MPLTLVTGPANAAKAGEVLGGPARPARRGADAGGARPSRTSSTPSASWPSAARCSARGCCASARCSASRAPAPVTARRSASDRPARADRRGGGARAHALEVLAESAARPGFAARRRPLRGRARSGSMVEPARLHAAPCATGPATGRGAATPTRWPRLPALPRGPRRGGAGGRGAVRAGGALDALRARPRRWGAHAGVRLRLRRLHAARARRARELSPAAAGRTWSSRCRSSPAAWPSRPWPSGTRASCSSWPPRSGAGRRSTTTTPTGSRAALHHLERGLFETEPAAPVDPGRAVRLARAGGERAEVRAVRRREVLELLREGTPPGDVAVVFRDPARYASLRGAGLRRLRHPLLDRPRGAAGAHGARPRAARAAPLRAARRQRPTTCWPTCARPGSCGEPGLADRLEAEVRHEGAHSAAQARARLGGDRRPLAAGRARPARAAARDAGELLDRAGAPARAAVQRARTERQAAVLDGRRARRRARLPRRPRGARRAGAL